MLLLDGLHVDVTREVRMVLAKLPQPFMHLNGESLELRCRQWVQIEWRLDCDSKTSSIDMLPKKFDRVHAIVTQFVI